MIAEAFMIYKFKDFYKKESINNEEVNFFDITKTGISFYDDILDNPDYFKKNKGIVMNLVYMSKEQYFKIISDWHNVSMEYQYRYILPNNINFIKDRMRSGVKYNTPILDYRDKSQEGRHRIIAADMLGQKNIPIYTIRYI